VSSAWQAGLCRFCRARRRADVANPPVLSETGLTGEDRGGSSSWARHTSRGPAVARHARRRGGRYGSRFAPAKLAADGIAARLPYPGAAWSGDDGGWPLAPVGEPAPFPRREGAGRVRIVLRMLCCVVIASAAITVWTRAALVFALGPQLTSVCLWIAAGGSLCAVITLAWTRKPGRRQRHRPPEPPAGSLAVGNRDRPSAVIPGQETRRQGQVRARRAAYTPGGERFG